MTTVDTRACHIWLYSPRAPCQRPPHRAPLLARLHPVGLGRRRARAVARLQSYALDKKNEGITRAFIGVHGGGRNADNNFRSLLAAAFLATHSTTRSSSAPRLRGQ